MPNRGTSYRLTNLDACFLYQESGVSQMLGRLIFFLKGELSFDKLFHHIEGRLHVAPRYRQRLLFPPFNLAHPTLEDDPDFKLENHVRRERLAEGISEADAVKEVLVYNNSRLLDRTRPLWCLTLFEGLPGRSLVLWEMHHAIVDGVSGFDLLNKTMDSPPTQRRSSRLPNHGRQPPYPVRARSCCGQCASWWSNKSTRRSVI